MMFDAYLVAKQLRAMGVTATQIAPATGLSEQVIGEL